MMEKEVAKLECIHHWLIDGNNVGTCRKCGAVKDFGHSERMFTSKIFISQRSHKGLPCHFKPTLLCQEGYCEDCQIYLDYKKGLDKVIEEAK